MNPPFLCIENASKTYVQAGEKRAALKDISFCVEQGEFVAVVGQSGAGKTTLLRLLSGLESIESGKVIVKDLPLHKLSEEERATFRREHIGFAFQLFELMEQITILENVALPLILAGRTRKLALEEAIHWLEAFHIIDLADAYPEDISGGEMQRVSLARALIHKPSLLLADEPTGSLDSLAAEDTLDLLESLRRKFHLTIVMVTHNTRAAAYADRVLRLKQGQLIAEKKGMMHA